MELRLEQYLTVLILLILVWIPYSTMDMKVRASDNTEGCCKSVLNTELNISSVQLFYHISPTGNYLCRFTLEVVGNNLTAVGPARCMFRIFDLSIEDFSIIISNSLINSRITENNTYTIISFSTFNLTFPVGFPFFIRGSFYGKYSSNASSIYDFTLGMDWGTTVGSQHIEITFPDELTFVSISNVQPIISSNSGFYEISWTDNFIQSFSTTLSLHPRQLQNTFLIIDFLTWNATIGQTKNILIQNIGVFETHGLILTPNWISTNVSSFRVSPNQKITVSFTINSIASPGMNGSIQIIVRELWLPMYISVTVLDATPQKEPQDGLVSFFFIVFSIFSGFLGIGLSYYKRDSLKEFFNHWKKGEEPLARRVSSINQGDMNITWESIQMRWEPILPEEELQVLKILFNQGVLNQKAIADQLGVSAMTMSRIISRLETKCLLVRERLGMSNMIKLNEDHL